MAAYRTQARDAFAALCQEVRDLEAQRIRLQQQQSGPAPISTASKQDMKETQNRLRLAIASRKYTLRAAREELVAEMHGRLWLAHMRWSGFAGLKLQVSGNDEERSAAIVGISYGGQNVDSDQVPAQLLQDLAVYTDPLSAQILWLTLNKTKRMEFTPYGVIAS